MPLGTTLRKSEGITTVSERTFLVCAQGDARVMTNRRMGVALVAGVALAACSSDAMHVAGEGAFPGLPCR